MDGGLLSNPHLMMRPEVRAWVESVRDSATSASPSLTRSDSYGGYPPPPRELAQASLLWMLEPPLDERALVRQLACEQQLRETFVDQPVYIVELRRGEIPPSDTGAPASTGGSSGAEGGASTTRRASTRTRSRTALRGKPVTVNSSDLVQLVILKAVESIGVDLGGVLYFRGTPLALSDTLGSAGVPAGATLYYAPGDGGGAIELDASAFASAGSSDVEVGFQGTAFFG